MERIEQISIKNQVKTNNNKNMKSLTILLGAMLASTVVVQQAQATSITGTVNFGGGVTLSSSSLNTATSITTFSTTEVTGGSGTYAAASPYFETVTWKTPLSLVPGSDVINPLWSFVAGAVTYSFDLSSITSYTVTGGNTVAALAGVGTLLDSAAGYTATPGNFTLTITDSSGGTSGTAQFGFAASSTAAGVPDGGLTVALLGGALTAMALVRSKVGKLK
jgi:hypothetical protein